MKNITLYVLLIIVTLLANSCKKEHVECEDKSKESNAIPHATIGNSFSATFNEATGAVDLKWVSTEEVSIKGYSLRIAPVGSTAAPIETIWVPAKGVGFLYNYPSQPDPGDYTYTIVAILASGAEQVPTLGTSTVTVPLPI